MRSTLKKSLYLGLAALSFASVAGAANNADAAKKTKPAKTYATANYQSIPDQGQSNIAYNVTGTNALFNKPGTVKGAKQTASKATMSDLASAKQNFMVYQKATTSRGSTYIKVVSFDKQYRGWIYAGNNTSSGYGTGVQRINLTQTANPQNSAVYLSNPGQTALKNSPEGAQFNASQNTFGHTGFVAQDAFNVDQAQTVSRTGTTWYHITNQKDNTINGWVPSNQVQLSSNNNYFDKSKDVKVNFTNNGQVVGSSIIDVSNLNKRYSNSNVLSPNDGSNQNGLARTISSYAGSALSGTGYSFNDFNDQNHDYLNNGQSNSISDNKYSGYNTNTSNNSNVNAIQYAEAGDTINLNVNNGSTNGNVASHLSFNVLGNQFTLPSALNTNTINVPSLDTTQLANQLNGYDSRQQLNMDTVLGIDKNNDGSNTKIDDTGNNIFGVDKSTTNPTKLGVLYGGTQYAQSNITNAVDASTTSITPGANQKAGTDNDVAVAQQNNVFNKTSSGATLLNNGSGFNGLNQNYTISQGQPFHYVYMLDIPTTRNNNSGNYGQNIKLYYKAIPVSGTSNFTTANTSTKNYFN